MAQNQCIFEYSNFGNGYLRIYFLKDNKTTENEIFIDLQDYPIKNGVVAKLEPLVERIKQELKELNVKNLQSPLLLLRCAEIHKNSLFLPIKSSFQANSLYKKEMKLKNNKDLFVPISNSYKSELGYMFNTYYIPKLIIESFNNIEKMLNTEFVGVQPLGMFLAEKLNYKGTYVYFYIKEKVCTMIMVSDKDLITSYDFEFETERDILSKFLLVASKHEFEVDKKQISYYDINSDESINVDLGIKRIDEK
ncbi:MAG: hypothetical protein J6S23_07260 [Clostridia bacterium]|nr:hypothetical protein [Clostridia bacterium]